MQFTLVKTQHSATQAALLQRSAGRWVQATARRLHSHDVRALALWPPHTPLPWTHRRALPADVAPVLVSGGLDMSVAATPAALASAAANVKVVNPLSTSVAATFEDAYQRRMAYASGPYHASGLHLARAARLLLCMRDAGVSVWRIHPRRKKTAVDNEDPDAELPDDGGWERVLDMELNVHTNLVASAISDDGAWIAVSDYYESKLFRIETLVSNSPDRSVLTCQCSRIYILLVQDDGTLKPRRVKSFTAALQAALPTKDASSTGASCFAFAPDSRRLVVATAGSAYVLVVDLGDSTPRVLRRFAHHRMRHVVLGERVVAGRKGPKDATSVEVEDVEMADGDAEPASTSADEPTPTDNAATNANADADDDGASPLAPPVAATVTRLAISADGQWLASTDDRCRTHLFNLDAVSHHCALPTLPQPAHALTFSSSGGILVIGTADHALHAFDADARAFPAWARVLAGAPQRFTHLHDPLLGASFDPAGGARAALFWGAGWLCRVQLDAGAEYGGFEKRRRGWAPNAAKPQSSLVKVTSGAGAGMDDARAMPQQNYKLVTHYRPLLFVDFIGPGELVVVERPLVDVLAKLPPAFFKPKYGAT